MDRMVATIFEQSTRLAASGASFVPAELLTGLDAMAPRDLDATGMAAVCLDDDDLVVRTTAAHDRLLCPAAPGTPWFRDVAPCANNRMFRGLVRHGRAEGRLDAYFTYAFTFGIEPTEMGVHLHRTRGGATWVFLRRR